MKMKRPAFPMQALIFSYLYKKTTLLMQVLLYPTANLKQ